MLQFEVIIDLTEEPVSLQEAKKFLQIDFNDFDCLISDLIKYAREASERNTGLAYGEKVIQVTGNTEEKRIYPFQPVPMVSEVEWPNESQDGTTNYRYKAGFGIAGETGALPLPLKHAILRRVATAFSKRENYDEAMQLASNSSQNIELNYRKTFIV